MDLTYSEWRRFEKRLRVIDHKLDQVLINQGKTMTAFDDLTQVVTDVVTGMGNVATEVAKIPPAVDRLEAKITQLFKDSMTPAQKQQLVDAIGTLRGVATSASAAAAKVAQAAADAADDIDEADVPVAGIPEDLTESEFDAAALAYTGADRVTKNGIEVHPGAEPTTAYFSHSATGKVNKTPPTD